MFRQNFARWGAYSQQYRRSLEDPVGFWADQAEKVAWFDKPPRAHIMSQDSNGITRWFKGGKCNMSYMALDAQVKQGRANQVAYIWDSPVTGKIAKYTYQEVLQKVEKLAGVMHSMGIKKGDTVVIYMPMIPETAFAMLACARLGAIHSVVFGGFAPKELSSRMSDARCKLILTASCGIEGAKVVPYKQLVDEALSMSFPNHTDRPKTIVVDRPECPVPVEQMVQGQDLFYEDLLADPTISPVSEAVPLDATDPLYIIYTSGTTGKPKGIVRDIGSYAVALKWSMLNLFATQPGQTFWAGSDFGWVVGHSYITYGPLLNGNSTIIFEGKPVKTPDAGTFWRVLSQHKVNSFFVAPTAIRAIKKEDPKASLIQQYDLSQFKQFFLAGERLDPPTFHWLKSVLHKDVAVIDNWWQTETGWPIATNPLGVQAFPIKPGSATLPVVGYDIRVLRDDGNECAPKEHGSVFIKRPMPPGSAYTIWRNHARYQQVYLEQQPGYFLCGDSGYKDEEGYLFIMGRVDDVINVAGHRLSTGEMEEVVSKHAAVAECAVVGIEDRLKGEVPVAYVVLKNTPSQEAIDEATLEKELAATVRREIGPVASFKTVLVVDRLPKTRSGKILRATIRKLSSEEQVAVPPTIDDPAIIDEISAAMKRRGVGLLYSSVKES
eukprot:g32875.t1